MKLQKTILSLVLAVALLLGGALCPAYADVTLMSCHLPYDAARYQAADAIVCVWSARGMSSAAFADVSKDSYYAKAVD